MKAKVRSKYVRPIDIRRPRRLHVRMEDVVHRGLFAIHAETGKSLSAIAHEAIVMYLKAKDRLDPDLVIKILKEEKVARRYLKVPVL